MGKAATWHARSNVVGLADPAALSALRSRLDRLDHMLHGVCMNSHIYIYIYYYCWNTCRHTAQSLLSYRLPCSRQHPSPSPPNPWPTSSPSRVQG